ncbi:hypothetical protein SAMN06296386_11369 [Lachnospiraceae bacterium]|nr:hypothetical protein SAMN06296386_11369 [Lachnospiraceae bacterium]
MNTAAFLIFYSVVWCMIFGMGIALQRAIAGVAVRFFGLPFTKLQIWVAIIFFTAFEASLIAMKGLGSF